MLLSRLHSAVSAASLILPPGRGTRRGGRVVHSLRPTLLHSHKSWFYSVLFSEALNAEGEKEREGGMCVFSPSLLLGEVVL